MACLEEVALRMGFIDQRQIEQLIGGLHKGEYRSYLELVCAEGGGFVSRTVRVPKRPGWRKKHRQLPVALWEF